MPSPKAHERVRPNDGYQYWVLGTNPDDLCPACEEEK